MVFSIKVKPNAKLDKLAYSPEGLLTCWIKAQPVDGKANSYLIGYLSQILKISKSSFEIIGGETNSNKRLRIDMEELEFKNKIEEYISRQ